MLIYAEVISKTKQKKLIVKNENVIQLTNNNFYNKNAIYCSLLISVVITVIKQTKLKLQFKTEISSTTTPADLDIE